MKKTLIIVSVVLVVLAGVIGYAWFSATTPSVSDIPQVNTNTSRTFSPFGSLLNLFSGTEPTEQTSQDFIATTTPRSVYDLLSVSNAYAVTENPVASAQFFAMGTTTGNVLRYIERETGHVYELGLGSGTTRRLSNTTVPRIQEAYFGNNGSVVVLRYLDNDKETIKTFLGTLHIPESESSGELVGDFLSENIQTVALHETAPGAFYTLKAGGGAVGRLYDPISRQSAPLFSSPLSEWTAVWNGPSSLLLYTKPSSSVKGFAYLVDPATGSQERLFENISGLTALPSPSGKKILVGSSGDVFSLFLYSVTEKTLTPIIGSTIPEKCVWFDDVSLICAIPTKPSSIDSWYEGSVSFTDSVWKIDTTTGLTDFLFDEETLNTPFDATHLSVSADKTVLSFINKKDSHLWVASLLQEPFSLRAFDTESENN